jgi:hypothetical protein
MSENGPQAEGGKARARKLSPEERKEIARRAAESRWGSVVPQATNEGTLVIAGKPIKCANLANGTRVLTQETFLKAIGRAAKAKAGTGSTTMLVDGMPPFLAAENLKDFISEELRQSTTPLVYRTRKGRKAFGYSAMLLPMVCEVYLAADDAGVLLKGQEHIAKACNLLIRGLARVGIIALVDEATGFQDQRPKDELTKILEAYISAELMPWTRMFPDVFFREIYRLQGWEYKPGSAKRTPYVGKLINKYIYEPLPEGVLPELRRLNPVTEKGYRRHKHFQFLTADTGNVHLDKQITATTTIMRISDTKEQFEENFAKAFPPKEGGDKPTVLVIDEKTGEHKRLTQEKARTLFDFLDQDEQ